MSSDFRSTWMSTLGWRFASPNEIEFLAFIYKASINSWQSVLTLRGLGDFVVEKMICEYLFCCSKFYWVVKMVEPEKSVVMKYIVSFDPVTKLYDILEKSNNELIRFCYLGEMRTCLCWCVLYEDNFLEWEVWTWEDNTGSFAFILSFSVYTRCFKPMCKLPDEQLLFGLIWV